jgi:hypothetical protein
VRLLCRTALLMGFSKSTSACNGFVGIHRDRRIEGKCSDYQWGIAIDSGSGLHHLSVDWFWYMLPRGKPSAKGTGRSGDVQCPHHLTTASYGLLVGTEPMEAKLAKALPSGKAGSMSQNGDGFRCVAFKSGSSVDLRAKSGKRASPIFSA